MSAYDDIIARLTALHPKLIDLSLDRMWRILERLGHPERSLPPVIHVAGTNGKGSTIAYLRAILVTFPYRSDYKNEIVISAHTYDRKFERAMDAVSVIYPQKVELKVKAQPSQASYRPGDD